MTRWETAEGVVHNALIRIRANRCSDKEKAFLGICESTYGIIRDIVQVGLTTREQVRL